MAQQFLSLCESKFLESDQVESVEFNFWVEWIFWLELLESDQIDWVEFSFWAESDLTLVNLIFDQCFLLCLKCFVEKTNKNTLKFSNNAIHMTIVFHKSVCLSQVVQHCDFTMDYGWLADHASQSLSNQVFSGRFGRSRPRESIRHEFLHLP